MTGKREMKISFGFKQQKRVIMREKKQQRSSATVAAFRGEDEDEEDEQGHLDEDKQQQQQQQQQQQHQLPQEEQKHPQAPGEQVDYIQALTQHASAFSLGTNNNDDNNDKNNKGEGERCVDIVPTPTAKTKIETLPSSSPSSSSSRPSSSSSGKEARVAGLKGRGNVLAEQGDMKGALAVFEEAIGLSPRNAVLFELKAQCHMQMEEYLEACKAASRAVDLAPDWRAAKLTLGRSYMLFGEVRRAVGVLSELCGRNPHDDEIRDELIYANSVLMELKRREDDFDKQLSGRAGLDVQELEVARCKRHLLSRGKEVPSDCSFALYEEEEEEIAAHYRRQRQEEDEMARMEEQDEEEYFR